MVELQGLLGRVLADHAIRGARHGLRSVEEVRGGHRPEGQDLAARFERSLFDQRLDDR